MTVISEIKKIIEIYSEKSGGSGINREKLESIFLSAELRCGEYLTLNDDLARIKGASAGIIQHAGSSESFIRKNLLKIMIPAAAAALLIAVLMFSLYSPVKQGVNVLVVSGDVYIMENQEKRLVRAGTTLHENDSVETGSGAVMEVAYRNRIIVKVLEKSSLSLGRLSGGDGVDFTMAVAHGRFLVYVQKLIQGDSIRVTTPWSEAVVRGTVFGIDATDRKKTVYEIFDGKVRVSGRLPAGNRALDREAARELERYFNENQVVLDKNSICSLEHNEALMQNISKDNVREKIRAAFVPRVAGGDQKFSMAGDALGFIGDIKKTDAGDPALDGVSKNIVLTGRESGAPAASGEKKVRRSGAFLSFFPGPNILLSISEDGIIEASNLKKVLWTVKTAGRIIGRRVDAGKGYL